MGGSATSLKAGVTVTLSDVSRYGDVQVEIRTNGTLNWRAWSFEPDFLFELKRKPAIRAVLTGSRMSALTREGGNMQNLNTRPATRKVGQSTEIVKLLRIQASDNPRSRV